MLGHVYISDVNGLICTHVEVVCEKNECKSEKKYGLSTSLEKSVPVSVPQY